MKRLVLASIALAASAASWADVGIYGGGSVGIAMNDVNCQSSAGCSVDKTATGWKLYGGYRVTPVIGAELTYFNFGKNKVTRAISTTSVDDDFDTKAVGIGASFHFDLAPKWSTDVHLGYARVKSSTTATISNVTGAADSHKNTPYIGVDAGYLVQKGLRVRAGWDFTSAIDPVSRGDFHENLFSVGASYEF